MKLSEIARYWAAKELTRIEWHGDRITLCAPFDAPQFTLRIPAQAAGPAALESQGQAQRLRKVRSLADLAAGTWCREDQETTVCFDLPRGESVLTIGPASEKGR
jgi:hypothetical protein